MLRFMLRLLILFALLPFSVFSKPLILVSVAPQSFIVTSIAQDAVDVRTLVPAGSSPHSWEPSCRQIFDNSSAAIWFLIGEPFEKKTAMALKQANPSLRLVDTTANLALLRGTCHCCRDDKDTHVWLSLPLVIKQAASIKEHLVTLLPDHQSQFESNYQQFVQRATEIDHFIRQLFQDHPTPAVLVSHPAFAYFCKDYGIRQLSIEYEGKEATPRQLTHLLKEAQDAAIRAVYIQKQYENKGALLIANQLHIPAIWIDPYAPNIFLNMEEIARAFALNTPCTQ